VDIRESKVACTLRFFEEGPGPGGRPVRGRTAPV
jgi:hypothetical protein